MGTSLNGLTPAGTYPGLIKTGDNAPIDGTLKTLSDGNGNNLPMSVSTTTINLTGTAQVGGVAIANTTQVAAKQDTLVSGTNIKTINGTSVLGSGNIVTPNTSPSGVAGAIQFSNGSAFASDAANLFWDDTNNRLGVGTNAPSATVNVVTPYSSLNTDFTFSNADTTNAPASLSYSSFASILRLSKAYSSLRITNFAGTSDVAILSSSGPAGTLQLNQNGGSSNVNLDGASSGTSYFLTNVGFGSSTSLGARVGIKGSGSTSATTSLLVQNSAGRQIARATDNGLLQVGTADVSSSIAQPFAVTATSGNNATMAFYAAGPDNAGMDFYRGGQFKFNVGIGGGSDNFGWYNNAFTNYSFYILSDATGRTVFGGATGSASAQVSIDSTTRGFLPPRMTTTQKNNINAPASGLVVYDSTTNKLCCYNGSTWNDLF